MNPDDRSLKPFGTHSGKRRERGQPPGGCDGKLYLTMARVTRPEWKERPAVLQCGTCHNLIGYTRAAVLFDVPTSTETTP